MSSLTLRLGNPLYTVFGQIIKYTFSTPHPSFNLSRKHFLPYGLFSTSLIHFSSHVGMLDLFHFVHPNKKKAMSRWSVLNLTLNLLNQQILSVCGFIAPDCPLMLTHCGTVCGHHMVHITFSQLTTQESKGSVSNQVAMSWCFLFF